MAERDRVWYLTGQLDLDQKRLAEAFTECMRLMARDVPADTIDKDAGGSAVLAFFESYRTLNRTATEMFFAVGSAAGRAEIDLPE